MGFGDWGLSCMNKIDPGVRRGRKFEQVISGARKIFLRDGFEGASVDDIARAAGVSKATLYSYFPDKRLLFQEVTKAECRRQAERAIELGDPGAPPEEALYKAGCILLEFATSPVAQRIYRICVAEAERFPELGRAYYESGPAVARDKLVQYLSGAVERDALRIDDIPLAAHQFIELCKAEIFQKVVFGLQSKPSAAEIDRIVRAAVETFLARYAAPAT